MTTLETLGAYVARGVRGKAAGAIADKIALHVADIVTAWVAGARTDEGRALTQHLAGGSLADQVALHCAVARLSEIDDIHLASCTTPGAILIPAAISIAATGPASGAALAEAILAGYDTMVRLGAAFEGPSILYRGIWPTYFTAPAGVAAVAARLFELDPAQAAHALSIALVTTAPGVGHPGGPRMARWLAIGQAGARGLAAARAAQSGFTGDAGLLDGEFMASVYAITPKLAAVTEGLGASYALDEVSCKPWCAARQTMAASQAARELVREGLSVNEISAVTVHVPPPYLRMVSHGVVSGDRSSYLTSVPYQIALALLDPDAQFRLAPNEAQLPATIKALMDKVSVQVDDKLLAYYPRAWPARVSVNTSSGAREKTLLEVPGDPKRPLEESGIRDKSARVLGPLIGESSTTALLNPALGLIRGDGRAAALQAEIARASAA